MADKNFIVKNGLEVGGQEVVSSSGVVTSAALGGQTLSSTDSPTFANLTVSNDLAVSGDLNLTGDLNITGDVNSLSVTDLDVTDQTITLGAGQVESASGGSGIVVDGSGASILWDETNTEFDINNSINVTGTVTATDLLIDTDVIVTDSTNDRVGINKTSPATTLDVGGSIYFSSILRGTSDGSASSPTIQPGNDGDTGLYRPATNQIGFTTAGTNALTIDASQNATFAGDVLIGSGGGLRLLPTDASDTDPWILYQYTDDTLRYNFTGSGADEIIIKYPNATNATTLLVDTEQKRVGIGTDSPREALEVSGHIKTNYSGSVSMDYTASTGAYWKGMSGVSFENSTARGLHIFNFDNDSNYGINFWVGTNASKVFAGRINETGNFGIGTDSPSGITNSKVLEIKNTSTGTGTHAQITLTGSNGHTNLLLASGDDSNGGDPVISSTGNHAIRFGHATNATFSGFSEAMRITDAGNLKFISQTTNFESPAFTYHTNNYLYLRGGSAGLILSDDAGQNTIQISDAADYIRFETTDGSERMRIDSSGNIQIRQNTNAPTNSVSLPGHLEFRGQGWDSNSGSDDMNAKIEMDATYGKVGSGATSPELVFSLQGAGGLDSSSEAYVEAMRIVGAGAYNSNRPRVGIGTDSPGTILQVGDGTTTEYITIDKSTTGESGILFKNAGNNKGKILLNSSEQLKFYINNTTDAMTINESVSGSTTTIPGVQIGNLSHGWGNLVVTADDNSWDGGITIQAASTSGGSAGYGALFWKQGGINSANTKWFMGFTNSTSGGAAYDDLLLGAYQLNTGYSKGGRTDGVMHFDRSNGDVHVAKQVNFHGQEGFKVYNSSGFSKGTNWEHIGDSITTVDYNNGGWAAPNSDGSRYATCFRHSTTGLRYISGADYCSVDSPLNGHSEVIYMNGSGDYVELYAYSSISTTWGGSSHSVWWGAEFLH
jgi:hypothetical protein